jgi:tetratricopeptide (TPR) repeat protein
MAAHILEPSCVGFASPVSAPPHVALNLELLTKAVDRLAACEESGFLCKWLSSLEGVSPALAVRRAFSLRSAGRLDEARSLLAQLSDVPADWAPRDFARLSHERAWFAFANGDFNDARTMLGRGVAALVHNGRPGATSELIDLFLGEARLELAIGNWRAAQRALSHASQTVGQLPAGPWGVQLEITTGFSQLQLARPQAAYEAFERARSGARPGSVSYISAVAWSAIALAAMGRFDEARQCVGVALAAVETGSARWYAAQVYHALALVERIADRAYAALRAIERAEEHVEDSTPAMLRFAISAQRALALARVSRTRAADDALQVAENVRGRMGQVERVLEHSCLLAQARIAESRNSPAQVIRLLTPILGNSRYYHLGDALLACARASLELGRESDARGYAEEACVFGLETGFVFAERRLNANVWKLALSCSDSRAVRFADAMLRSLAVETTPESVPPPTGTEETLDLAPSSPSATGTKTVWLTTRAGVRELPLEDALSDAARYPLAVDLLTHRVRIGTRLVSLSRHRALEPLLVQMLRRADSGLTGEQVLAAAGGPGPESADSEHRIRVLISRLRALLGRSVLILTERAEGERAGTLYRLAPELQIALIEPTETRDDGLASSPSQSLHPAPRSTPRNPIPRSDVHEIRARRG